jgi:hypothetical protein
MITSNLIQRIGERIEQLDTAIFFGPPSFWRYPACIIRRIKVDRTGDHLWFRMKNISLDDAPGKKAPAFLFCYNKQLNFYMTVEGNAAISGLAGDLKTPDGWQDPLFAHQTTYLVRMEIRQASTFYRPALPVVPNLPVFPAHAAPTSNSADPARRAATSLFPDRSYIPPIFVKKAPRFNLSSFLTSLF